MFGGGVKRFLRNAALSIALGVTIGVTYSAVTGYLEDRNQRVRVASPSIVRTLMVRKVFGRSRESVAKQPIPNSYDFVRNLPGEDIANTVRAYEQVMSRKGLRYDSKSGRVRTREKTSGDDSFNDSEIALSRKMDSIANNYLDSM